MAIQTKSVKMALMFFNSEMERFSDNCLETPISIIFLSFTELQYNDVYKPLQ